jgi:fructokinase
LPKGLFLGGAPANAGYHLARQGLHVLPISAVGRDFLGEEALRRVKTWGVETTFIGISREYATGTVRASLDPAGVASYQFTRDVAWDHISISRALRALRPSPAAIVHGTLALRTAANRRALDELLKAWPRALRVLDVNLRAPFDDDGVIAWALQRAQLIKLNDAELVRITGLPAGSPSALAKAARQLSSRCGDAQVCVTAGEKGAGLWWQGKWNWESGRRVDVRDTVGAGDAFLGGLLGGLLKPNPSPARCLAQACRLGEFVASRDGATPDYSLDRSCRPIAAGSSRRSASRTR